MKQTIDAAAPVPAPPPVRPVVIRQCFMCHGSGVHSQDYTDGRCVSSSCSNCAGRGYVATEGGEA